MGIQSIDRAVGILDLLSRSEGGLPISEVCAKLDLPLGTAHRFLHSLIDNGLVAQDDKTKFYFLGMKMLRLAAGMLNNDRLIEAARTPMLEAAQALRNIVYLSRQTNGDVVCVSCVNPLSDTQARFAAQIGALMPIHAAAAGKIVAAYASQAKVDAMIAHMGRIPSYTALTLVRKNDIIDELQKCRRQGYAVCDEELENGVIAVAAPVRNYDGSVRASVAVTAIKANVVIDDLIENIVRCGQEVSRSLGWGG